MSNDHTSDQAGQPCVGPEGHTPPGDRRRLRAPIPDYPDITFAARSAAIDEVCIGSVTHRHDDLNFHARTFTVYANPADPRAPKARIHVAPEVDGIIRARVHGANGLVVAQIDYLRAAWQHAIERGLVTITGGRQFGATTYPKDVVHGALQQSRELRAQGISRAKRAAQLQVPETTLRYWEKQAEKNPEYPF